MTVTPRHQTAAVLAALLPHLKWRHHGIGVLQAYVREHDEPEVRVHVWDPRLMREGIRDCGDAHDHRFDLESTVLVGEIHETVYGMPTTPHVFYSGDLRTGEMSQGQARSRALAFDIWRVENARSAADRNFDGECVLEIDGKPFSLIHRTHPAGTSYTLPRGVFHRTEIEQLTVTLCTMREKRGQARILVPAGREPVHAFGGEPAPAALQTEIIEQATELLKMAGRASF